MRKCIRLGWASIAAVCATTTGAWAQTPITFAAAPSFSAGTSPTGATAGLFNADAKLDLAVTNQHGIAILINDGNGGFLSRVDYSLPTCTNPQAVTVFSHGLAVVCQGASAIVIMLSNGDGTFHQGVTYPAGVNPRGIIEGDFNHDGRHDLAIVDSGAGAGTSGVSVLLGNGDGTFQATKFYPAGTTSLSLASGDLNGDGRLDLAVANTGSDDISVLIGNSDGSFQAPVNYSLNQPGITVSPTSVAIGDFNNDSKLDLAVATPSVKGYAILLGLGNGTFQAPAHYTLDDPNFVNNNNTLIAANLNGDLNEDLVLANYSANHVTVLRGAGDGTFPTSASYAAGPSPAFIVVSAFKNNLVADVAAVNDVVDGAVSMLYGNGDGTLQGAPQYRSAFTPQSLAVGDLNNDGILDIVAASPGAGPGVGAGVTMLGNGDGFVFGKGGGTFKPPVTWTTTGATSVALGDFDGDGKLDLVSTEPTPGNGNVSVWLGKGDGTFQTPTPFTAGTTPDTVVVADVNGDKKLDLVVGNHSSGNISVLLGNGDGTFQAASTYSTPATGTPDSLVVTDFNGDGKPDIAVAISGVNATSVALLLGNGNGTFQTAIVMPSGFHSSGTLRIAAGDFNSDGKFDLAVTDGTTLSVLAGNGTGAISTPAMYTLIGPGAAINGSIAVADFNGDNIPDIAVTNRDGIFVLSGAGADPFQSAINYYPSLGGAIAIGDFNGDNRPDIVTADSSQDQIPTDTVAVLLNTTTFHTAPFTLATSPSGLSVDIYYGFPPGGILSEYTTCGAAPCTYNAVWGNFVQLYASPTAPGPPGTRYFLDSFSDGGTSLVDSGGQIIHNVIFPGVAYTETVKYRPQYQVTIAVTPTIGGSATPASGTYVDPTATLILTATANPGYTFAQWTSSPGGLVSFCSSCAESVGGPVTWTASFNFTGQRCDLNADVQLTAVDVQSIIQQALGLAPPTADLNHDGVITIADTQVLLQAVRGAGTCPQ